MLSQKTTWSSQTPKKPRPNPALLESDVVRWQHQIGIHALSTLQGNQDAYDPVLTYGASYGADYVTQTKYLRPGRRTDV